MALKTGFPAVSGATQFPDLRLLFAGDIVCDTTDVPRAGVLPANFDPIVTGRIDLKVDVAAMSYITVRSGGVIRGYNDGVVQVTLPALPTANSRIDILWVRQPMAASPTSDGSDVPLFGWTTGVASATPVRPSTALPSGALEIAQVQVAFNATATNDGTKVTITQTAPFTAFAGGTVAFRNTTEMNLWSAGETQQAVDFSLGTLYQRIGGAWVNTGGARVPLAAPTMNASAPAWTWGADSTLTRRADEIHVEALLVRAGGITAGVQICTLPVSARPKQIIGFNGVLVSGGSTGFFSGVVGTDGVVSISAVSNTTSTAARVNFSFLANAS